MVPVCASRKYGHCTGNRHYSAYNHYWLFPSVPSNFTDTIAGNRHYSSGIIEGPLLLFVVSPLGDCRGAEGYYTSGRSQPRSSRSQSRLYICLHDMFCRTPVGRTQPRKYVLLIFNISFRSTRLSPGNVI